MTAHFVIPGYNCADYAGACIRSVARQNYPDIRLHIYSDGSTDGTPDTIHNSIIAASSLHSEAVQRAGHARPGHLFERSTVWVSLENQGAAHARHILLTEAIRDGVVFLLDLDDCLPDNPDLVTKTMALHAQGADFTYGTFRFSDNRPTGSWKAHVGYDEGDLRDRSFRQIPWRCWPLRTFNRYLYDGMTEDRLRFQGDWLRAATDAALAFYVMERAQNMVYVPEVRYVYNGYHPNVSRRRYKNKSAMMDFVRNQPPAT